MPLIELFFGEQTEVPTSLQVGDTAYYISGTDLSTLGLTFVSDAQATEQNTMTTIGLVDEITIGDGGFYVICDISSDTTPPTTTDFILFAKDNEVNLSSLKGYFGKTKLINDSTEKAELYAISCEIVESSK